MTCRSDSGSRRSPSAVEPVTSVNRIVTVLRVSRAGVAGVSSVPQNPHKRKRAGFSSPHAGHRII